MWILGARPNEPVGFRPFDTVRLSPLVVLAWFADFVNLALRQVLMWSLRLVLVAVIVASVRFQLWSWENANFGQRGRESGLFFVLLVGICLVATFRSGETRRLSRSDRIMAAARRAH